MNNHHHHYHLPPPLHNNHFFPPNPSFNPNQNPNFNPAFIPAPPPPLQPQSQPESSTDAPLPDLSTALSHLTDLLDLSSSTLDSLSSLLSLHPLPNSSEQFSRCPINSNHLMPPESLFLHSLHCPSPIAEDVRSLLDDLQYPKTLKTESQLIQKNEFVNPLQDSHSELCFSFDDYVDFGSNFFYQDCPGVVSSLGEDPAKKMFSLPKVLSVECANFSSGTDWEANDSFRLLPSELWVVQCETGQWSDFPNAYSFTVLRTLLLIESVNERHIQKWVIANSPRFGVVIDSPMRDHIFVLFRLCVKALVREARSSHAVGHLNPKSMSFSCPSLVEVLSWLATQLSVLYGEVNAKLFTIGVLKQFIQNAASNSLLYPLDKVMEHELGSSSAGNFEAEQLIAQASENKVDSVMNGWILSRPIYIYQVAVAIAALHERSLFEDKIKALRNHQYMTAYQRVSEHSYLSKKAQEEREKRPHYRPLVDHDGLPVQSQHDKDMMDRNKTKEQLLAEERDYKRRRMSYRGKKTKRNVKEVMRDIIEEHMEAIRVAGGIGIFDKSLSQDYGESTEFKKSASYEYEPSRHQHLKSDYVSQQPMDSAEEQKASSRSRHRDDSYHRNLGRERNQEDRRNGKRENYRHDSYPRSPSREGNYRSSRDKRSDWEKEDDSYPRNPSIDRKYGNSRHRNSDKEIYKSRNSNTSSSTDLRSGRKDKLRSEDKDRERKKRARSDSMSEFDDRYAPSRSPNM